MRRGAAGAREAGQTTTSEARPASWMTAPTDSAARPKRPISRGANTEPRATLTAAAAATSGRLVIAEDHRFGQRLQGHPTPLLPCPRAW